MDEVEQLTKNYPRFADGRIDYTHARACAVLNCTVVYRDEVLLAFRGKNLIAYPETWNGISGFIDEIKPFDEIVRDELAEEVNIQPDAIAEIIIRPKMVQVDEAIDREWHVWPVLVVLGHIPDIKTNWENKEVKWVAKDEVLGLMLMPFYAETFRAAIG